MVTLGLGGRVIGDLGRQMFEFSGYVRGGGGGAPLYFDRDTSIDVSQQRHASVTEGGGQVNRQAGCRTQETGTTPATRDAHHPPLFV